MAKDTDSPDDTKQSINILLIILLVIASFLIGTLWTNVEYLKKGNTNSAPTNQIAAITVNPPEQETRPYVTATPTPTVQEASQIEVKLSPNDHIRGDVNAQIALIEYTDLECPFCKQFHPTVKQVLDSYQGKVMWVFRHFPLSFHANAQKEAEATECAYEQGGDDAFWKYVDKIYERTTSNGTGFSLDQLAPLAKELGLDGDKLQKCLNDGKYEGVVNSQHLLGQNEGISGTPGNILLNVKTGKTMFIPGAKPFSELKSAIDSLL